MVYKTCKLTDIINVHFELFFQSEFKILVAAFLILNNLTP
jgi:hypothetical protein